MALMTRLVRHVFSVPAGFQYARPPYLVTGRDTYSISLVSPVETAVVMESAHSVSLVFSLWLFAPVIQVERRRC